MTRLVLSETDRDCGTPKPCLAFPWEGMDIVYPYLSACGRFEVNNPAKVYGMTAQEIETLDSQFGKIERHLITSVCVHGFMTLADGNVTYDDSATPDGWGVYARRDLGEGQFDIEHESEFTDLGEALAFADTLAETFGVSVERY